MSLAGEAYRLLVPLRARHRIRLCLARPRDDAPTPEARSEAGHAPDHPLPAPDGSRFGQLAGPPVFVMGHARSGTTWVYDVLRRHPEVAGVFETQLFTSSDGLRAMMAGDDTRLGWSGLGSLVARSDLVRYVRGLAEQIYSHAIEPQHRYLVEKSPAHVFDPWLVHEVFPEARIVLVVRDGRDVCVSSLAAAYAWAPSWRQGFARSVRHFAHDWLTALDCAERFARSAPHAALIVRYEDLHADPVREIRRLFDFAGIPCDDARIAGIAAETDFARNYPGGESAFRRAGRVGDWRRAFSLWDALAFHAVAGAGLRRLRALGEERAGDTNARQRPS